jgi:capsular polysaccharide transport system ATP-binding protein
MITVANLCKTYDTRKGPKRVLQNVCLSVKPGQHLGILGRNGSGKSTLVRCIGGVEPATSGRVERSMKVSWPLGYAGAFQPHLTGLDNLRFICRLYAVDYQSVLPFVKDFSDLGADLREPVVHYSTGMRARLAFALSMAVEFDCFLIDEVLAAGDSRFHERCRAELFEKRKDRAMIIVSHDPNAVTFHCDSAAVLRGGRLTSFEKVEDAYAYYESDRTAQ